MQRATINTVKTELGWISYGKDDDGDWFVTINTEDAAETVNDEDGCPRLFVYLNDATLYNYSNERD